MSRLCHHRSNAMALQADGAFQATIKQWWAMTQ